MKTHGYKGGLRISFDPVFRQDLASLENVMIFRDGQYLPYFIQKLEIISDDEALVSFEDLTSSEAARPLCGNKIFAEEDVLSTTLKRNPYELVEGYKAIDEEMGEIGIVNEILKYPNQIMANILYNDNDVLIPLNDIFVTRIDKKAKTIFLNLPEGLLDLNV